MTAKARGFAAASLLGLPIALLAHALVFGGEHSVAGAFSTAVLGAGAFVLLAAVAIHSRDLLQGSVLAKRVRDRTPCFAALAASGSAWFTAIELCERAHNAPLIAIAIALAVACVILRFAVTALARSIAGIVVVLTHGEHARALLENRTFIACNAAYVPRSFAHTRRLFSRPPPALS